ncbi:MAG TPA: NAD(P)H-dependent oxidoreductase [Croceibacterium sp.]|nr:NAD(P)H-dependent oxidoreductase [Croceibacterium sp.]
MGDRSIAVIVGSIREGSFSRQLAHALLDRAPAGLSGKLVQIDDLPLYNPDLDDGTPPAAWTRFRNDVRPVDGLLFVTPEYNRSVPGVLKNAIDVGSRPYGKSIFSGKPGAIVSCSPGALSAFGANHHLRQSLVFLDVPVMQQPEAYIGNIDKLLGKDGGISDAGTDKFLANFMKKFAEWIERHS